MRRSASGTHEQQVFTCGTVDQGPIAFDAAGQGWPTLNLTFSIGTPPPEISVQTFETAVRTALETWKEAVPFNFTEVQAGGILSIAGVPMQHGDIDFRPQSIELAHAFGPVTGGGELDGQAHLNNAKRWADGPGADADVLTIVLHELGHALGIRGHFDDPAAVMNGSFPAGLIRRELTPADKDAMLALYRDLVVGA